MTIYRSVIVDEFVDRRGQVHVEFWDETESGPIKRYTFPVEVSLWKALETVGDRIAEAEERFGRE
jgi:hypothetical protein